MISISFNHLVAIVCIIGILACVGFLIYDHFKANKRRRKPVKISFKNTKPPRSRKRKK
ncbi:hypothetical protein [Candidatus Liberibacter solanacearum]|uniref:hypothetical protein n=1 Tax=Candidatus Liberibacter solanacearum TaxID=556287 RepID=UPI0015712611|nr:hypothetical protein [Candidatus Liberibacter solanacearum]